MSTGTGAIRSAPVALGGPSARQETTDTARPVARAVPRDPSEQRSGILRIDFGDQAEVAGYVLALASLLGEIAEELVAIDVNGQLRDDLDLTELQQRLQSKRIASLRIRVALDAAVASIAVAIGGHETPASIILTVPIAEATGAARPLWVQADPAHLGPLPLLMLPVCDGALAVEALHALVALAVRRGGFASANLKIGSAAEPTCSWSTHGEGPGAIPVVGTQNDSYWRASEDHGNTETAVAWFVTAGSATKSSQLSAEWLERLRNLLRQPSPLAALEQHLRVPELKLPPFRIVELEHAPEATFMVPPEDGIVASLHPTAETVIVAIDFRQEPGVLEGVALHVLGHLALGQVQPGDKWGHWDTANTVASESPHRVWDQQARDFLARSVAEPRTRRVESLEQCTPVEKAQLGLWRMIGEMLGESRRLNPAAERYQRAAYQRHAAQRLVSMLDDFGGAMLCDGVGLGKTYVATTLMVHYVNAWRERWTSTPDRLVEDPFRITVVAPNSVVSTWRREALPGLAAFGVPLATVRVLSHSQLSRVVRASGLMDAGRGRPSDMEHLLLSDLVIVDEAHNFRSLAARRTKVLRDLLRVQPRRERRRRVALLTATPINNSLDDLRQEVSLLFSRPIWLSDAKTDDGYRTQAVKEIQDRCAKARSAKAKGDVAALLVHGQVDAAFSDSIEFRDDLDFGPNVQRIGDYLKEQDKRLKVMQDHVRFGAHTGKTQAAPTHARIAEDLLDRIVVQRSRALCKEIERQQSSTVELLFRPDGGPPEKLRYSDEYDGIEDVLAGFLPLFEEGPEPQAPDGTRALSFKIYMWYDVREGIKTADDSSSVVGLQRVLVLKRLESSPVSFLITLLRLTVLHAYRLQQLGNLCHAAGDKKRLKELRTVLDEVIARQSKKALTKIRSLAVGSASAEPHTQFIQSLSAAYSSDRPAADTDDPPPQMSLFEGDSEHPKAEELDRLWTLRDALLEDFETLLQVTPQLADIVFGKFEQSEWPHRFIAGGEAIDWPTSPDWGQRVVTDAKIRQLVSRLLVARRAGQKVVVFSQFSDTIAYIQSVLRSCRQFSRTDWQVVIRGLGVEHLRSEELTKLLDATATITGDTEDRDELVNAFAPYYRIGPVRPVPSDGAAHGPLGDSWEISWTGAISRPVDVLLATDVLAEGVNLQDAALVINYDVHWNPVRMIQRAGRIDRRLNPRIEHERNFTDLAALATRLGRPLPQYYWHEHTAEAPVTVNMILPDGLEEELLLRERIATKTLAIDFTLGLEQGTGAEAEWMSSYKYQGITSLNSLQKDRAIEQIGGHHERLSKIFALLGVRPEWAENLNGWFRCRSATDSSPLMGRALVGRRGGELERFTRYLEPKQKDGVTYWCWAEKRPGDSIFDGWLVLDGKPEHFPPVPRRDIPFNENDSTPVRAAHLLRAAELLAADPVIDILPPRDIGRPLMQGASALSAPKLGTDEDRRLIAIRDFYLLQFPAFEPERTLSNGE